MRLPFYRRFAEGTGYDMAQATAAEAGRDRARLLAAHVARQSGDAAAARAREAAQTADRDARNAGYRADRVDLNPGPARAARSPHALALLGGLLALDPRRRTSARAALEHAYFWSDPMPCAPRQVPTPSTTCALAALGVGQVNEQLSNEVRAARNDAPAPAAFVPAFMRLGVGGGAGGGMGGGGGMGAAAGAGMGGGAGRGPMAPGAPQPPAPQQHPLRPPLPAFTPGITPGAPPLPPGGPPRGPE